MAGDRSYRTEGTCSGSLRSRGGCDLRARGTLGVGQGGWWCPITHHGYACGPATASQWQTSWSSESTGSVALGQGRKRKGGCRRWWR